MSAVVNSEFDTNKNTVTRFFAAITCGDYGDAAQLATSDATWWSLTKRESRPLATTLTRIANQAADIPAGLNFTVGLLTAEQNRVSALVESHAEFADGRVYGNRYHFLFRFRSGRIAAVSEYHDTAHANRVLRPSNGKELSCLFNSHWGQSSVRPPPPATSSPASI